MSDAHNGEFAAFATYAIAFPRDFLALIDTYDVVKSGILNFVSVAMALNDLGYRPIGVRIDSGDLAYLSNATRKAFEIVESNETLRSEFGVVEWFAKLRIIASNDINEETIASLNKQVRKNSLYKFDCKGLQYLEVKNCKIL